MTTVRPLGRDDLQPLATVLDATGVFPGELLDGMAADHLSGSGDGFWLTAATDAPIGLAYCVPEQMTDGTWNLLAIAVDPAVQGAGHGGALLRSVEAEVTERGGRLLLIDTSGTDAFAASRAFYRARGYAEEARIRDFWQAGDDKVTFTRRLG